MKKGLIVFRNIIVGIIFALYLAIIVGVSTLILTRNDYGVTQFGEKALIIIDKTNENERYKAGQLVVVESRKFEDLKIGQEVFVYQTDMQAKTVTVVSSSIKEINNEEQNKHIVLQSDGTAWGDEFIAGEAISIHDNVGKVLQLLQSKWIFFIIFIVPLFFVLLYLIYKIVVVIKFESDDLTEEEMELLAKKEEQVVEPVQSAEDEKITALMNEIASLKEKINNVEENKVSSENTTTVVEEKSTEAVEKDISNQVVVETPVVAENPVVEGPIVEEKTIEEVKVDINNDYAEEPIMILASIDGTPMVQADDFGVEASMPQIITTSEAVDVTNEQASSLDNASHSEGIDVSLQDMKPIIIDNNGEERKLVEENNVEEKNTEAFEADEEVI